MASRSSGRTQMAGIGLKAALLTALFLVAVMSSQAQITFTSPVTGTVKDGIGVPFSNGTWQAQLKGSGGYLGPFTSGGVTLTAGQRLLNGNLDANGAFSIVSLASNPPIVPAGSLWWFTFCPTATSLCYVTTIEVFGVTQDITSEITPASRAVLLNPKAAQPGGGAGSFADTVFQIFNTTDTSKLLGFSLVGEATSVKTTLVFTSSVPRSLIFPDISDTISTSSLTETFSNKTFSDQIRSTLATGTAPFSVASSTLVTNLNVNFLQGATWAAPPAIGSTTPADGTFVNSKFSTLISNAGGSPNPAQSGAQRLQNADQICWRNNAGTGDVCLSKDSSDTLNYPGIIKAAGFTATGTGGMSLTAVVFASLGTPVNGTLIYCSDCNVATDPCTGGGTGALALRLNGRFRCQ